MTAEVLAAAVRIAAPPSVVFPYFTDPVLMVQWIGDWAELTAAPGGAFALDINKTPVRGHYVEIDPPRRVVFTWGVAGNDTLPPGSTTVEVVLTADQEETLVELFHHDLPAADFPGHLEGWTGMLARLATLWPVSP